MYPLLVRQVFRGPQRQARIDMENLKQVNSDFKEKSITEVQRIVFSIATLLTVPPPEQLSLPRSRLRFLAILLSPHDSEPRPQVLRSHG